MPFQNSIFFRVFMVYRIQRRLIICLHHSQSQEMPSKAMARAMSAASGRIFPWGGPRRRGLWHPWPGGEKHLLLAQLQQDSLLGRSRLSSCLSTSLQHQRQIKIVCLRFCLASCSWSSRSYSEKSWSPVISGPFSVHNLESLTSMQN